MNDALVRECQSVPGECLSGVTLEVTLRELAKDSRKTHPAKHKTLIRIETVYVERVRGVRVENGLYGRFFPLSSL